MNLNLRLVKDSTNDFRPWDDIDNFDSALIEAGIGLRDGVPSLGTFTLAFGASTTPPLAFDITAADLETALNILPDIITAGGITIDQGLDQSSFQVTFVVNGARALITGDGTLLYPQSGVVVYEVVTGTGSLPEVQVISLRQLPVAYQNSWSPFPVAAAVIEIIQTPTISAPAIYSIAFNPLPYDGTFSITLPSLTLTTGAIAWNASASDVQAALNAIVPGGWSVMGQTGGTWILTRIGGATDESAPTVDVSELTVPTGVNAVLGLNTLRMLVLFSQTDQQELELVFEIAVTFPGQTKQIVFSTACTVSRDLLNQSTIVSVLPGTPVGGIVALGNNVSGADILTGILGPIRLISLLVVNFTDATPSLLSAFAVAYNTMTGDLTVALSSATDSANYTIHWQAVAL